MDILTVETCLHNSCFQAGGKGKNLLITPFPENAASGGNILSRLHVINKTAQNKVVFKMTVEKAITGQAQVQANYYYYHFVGHCGAFCGLKWRIWRAKMYFSPLI